MLRGRVERLTAVCVSGWAHRGGWPVRLRVLVDGVPRAQTDAAAYRPDLHAEAGGHCAFAAWFDPPLHDGAQVAVLAGPQGTPLPGTPVHFHAAPPAFSPWRPDLGRRLALLIDPDVPDPARDAGSAALLRHAAALRRLGFAVRFATPQTATGESARLAGRVRLAWLHRLDSMSVLPLLRAANPGVLAVFSVADLAHLRAARHAALTGADPPAALRAVELAACRAADAVLTHSPVEAALLRAALPGAVVGCVGWDVPVAADPPPFAQRAGVGFIGNYGHAPNPDAAADLLDTIMPLVWRAAPVPLVLAGHGLPRWLAVRAAGAAGPVRVVGSLPDAAAFWRAIRVSAAPLRFGAGIKGKVLDSFGAGVPCVCSPIAAEGLAVPRDLIHADPAGFAAALLRLHGDAAASTAATAAGQAMLPGPDDVAAGIAALLAAAAAQPAHHGHAACAHGEQREGHRLGHGFVGERGGGGAGEQQAEGDLEQGGHGSGLLPRGPRRDAVAVGDRGFVTV